MEIRLLGPLEVRDGETRVTLPRRQQRALLAALALRAGDVVSTDRLVAELWGERAPASAVGSLQNAVSALRKALGPGRLVTQPPGYRLAVVPDDVDAARFERLLAAAREAEPERRLAVLEDALGLWRGPALADVGDAEFARLAAGRLEALLVAAQEERIDAALELGRHALLVGELESLVAAHPLRERLRGRLMLALYRCGRQAEALDVYRATRVALAEELGLDPSPELQELERAILRQDASLAAPGSPPAVATPERAERRLVTVLAAVPPTDDDPERLRARLDELLAQVRDVLARRGGTLERFGPEGLVAVFGADAPRDDDAHRAAAAAEELGLPAGIATGDVVAGAGEPFSRAAELARGRGIRLDARTQALVRAERRLAAPLVDRRDELARLEGALDAAAAERRCRVVTVLGEPGIGKTRLVRELAERRTGEASVLVASCVAHGAGSTFLPLLDALAAADAEGALAGEPDGELARERLAALAGDGPTSLGDAYWAVRRLLEALAARRPVLLGLDDVHWAEPALLDLVEYLEERVDGPLLVLCLARPELERPAGELLRLAPLSDDDADAVARDAADLDDPTRARVVALAEGNPLYVEQLAAFAAESGEGLPPTLEAVLAGRLGQLGDAERVALEQASVLGREFTRAGLEALAGAGAAAPLATLSRRGLVGPAAEAAPGDDAYRFAHVLVRDAAYALLTKRDRSDLHRRAAEWLDRGRRGDDAVVGWHLEQAALRLRDLGEDATGLELAAGERLGAAAMRAWRGNDTHAAVGLLRRATALLPAGELRAELLCELGVAEANAGSPGAPAALARAAGDATAAGSERLTTRIAVERAWLSLWEGGTPPHELLETALAATEVLARECDERGLGRAWLAVSNVREWACRYAAAGEAARRAARAYAGASFSPALASVAAAYSLLYGPAPVSEAVAECERLHAAAPDRLTEAHATAVLASLAALDGRHADAAALLDRARTAYEDLAQARALSRIWRTFALLVRRRAGDADGAVALAREAAKEFEDRREPADASTWSARLAALLLRRGAHDEARRVLADARRQALGHDLYVQFLWRSTAAGLAAREGRHAEAETLALDALELASGTDSPLLLADLHAAHGDTLRLAGRPSEAEEAFGRARELLRRKGDVAGLAELERLVAGGEAGSPVELPAPRG